MMIRGLGTANPTNRFTQVDCWEFVRRRAEYARLPPRAQAILRKVLLGDNGIDGRYLALQALDEVFALDPDRLHARFAQHAPALAAAAAANALADAQISAAEVDGVIISACTGYLCPGLSSYVAERLRLRPEIIALDLVGQGCGAALPNLAMGGALIQSGRARHLLSICVEVCSAAFYFDDDPGVLISACLFGDGAGAAVLSSEPAPARRRAHWRNFETTLDPSARECLRFEQRRGMLRNVLTLQVPEKAATHAAAILERNLRAERIAAGDIRAWIVHAGGRDVLASLRKRLGLAEEDLAWSSGVLRDYGNLSSPFVLFALERALRGDAPAGWWWLCSFGAGFSCHGALLEIEKSGT